MCLHRVNTRVKVKLPLSAAPGELEHQTLKGVCEGNRLYESTTVARGRWLAAGWLTRFSIILRTSLCHSQPSRVLPDQPCVLYCALHLIWGRYPGDPFHVTLVAFYKEVLSSLFGIRETGTRGVGVTCHIHIAKTRNANSESSTKRNLVDFLTVVLYSKWDAMKQDYNSCITIFSSFSYLLAVQKISTELHFLIFDFLSHFPRSGVPDKLDLWLQRPIFYFHSTEKLTITSLHSDLTPTLSSTHTSHSISQ